MVATKKYGFSLVELIVSMSVLTVIMLALVNFYTAAQNGWSSSTARSELYENANVIFNIITQDLQSFDKCANNFYCNSGTPILAFVCSSSMEPNKDFTNPHFEVIYTTNGGWFNRACVSDQSASGWDFKTSTSWYTTPDATNSDYNIVPGVVSLTFSDKTGTAISATTTAPDYLVVTLTLLNKNDYAAYQVISDATAKTNFGNRNGKKFTKTYYLGDRL